MIRVLVADDSHTARLLLVSLLEADPDVHVIAEARSGLEAVDLAGRLRPDVISMDIRMPGLDGFEATKQIMTRYPTPIVIVSSVIDTRDVQISMYALRLGALSILPTPVGPGAPDFAAEAERYVDTIKSMSQVRVVRHWPAAIPRPASIQGISLPRPEDMERELEAMRFRAGVVAIAASTGGPPALHRILTELPGDFALPILVVQHIAAGFVRGLADWLNAASSLEVVVAESGEELVGGRVYLAPEGRHLGVSRDHTVELSLEPPVGGFRPSGNWLYETVAAAYGTRALAIILTGMGRDGVDGLRHVRAAGGRVVAQDEASSLVFGMPGVAVAERLVDQVMSLERMAAYMVEMQ